jgi:hypothetical protein
MFFYNVQQSHFAIFENKMKSSSTSEHLNELKQIRMTEILKKHFKLLRSNKKLRSHKYYLITDWNCNWWKLFLIDLQWSNFSVGHFLHCWVFFFQLVVSFNGDNLTSLSWSAFEHFALKRWICIFENDWNYLSDKKVLHFINVVIWVISKKNKLHVTGN